MVLYKLMSNYRYRALQAETICNRLVVGIRGSAPSHQLQLDLGLTLESAKKASEKRYMNSRIS